MISIDNFPSSDDTETSVSEATLSVENVARFKSANKKLITWTFVDTLNKENQEAHIVTLQWNKRSGKMVITMDGTQVCSYKHKGNDIISHKWQTPDGMKLVIVAARVTPNGVSDNFQKYGLIVNGYEVPLMKSSEAGYDGQPVEASSIRTTSILQMLYPNGYSIDSKTEDLLLFGEELTMEAERMLLV
eukprot:CAMPEP_0113655088 /NCGR_PEP_ID=MMETSP0017_2-20120614/29506_1 /TAXON_ID=2856 /ORGANISM="Cylindrotheca closterium" /LENGTH=187 /DNA_ID=CAMNT_0000568285 /DNA_START=115 /DNA_END=678 /DNA_ORIENTATION=+ /assembly_acc=CAM_ASM_000147